MCSIFLEVVCDEQGDNDAQLDRINVFYHGTSRDKSVPHAALFDLKPGVIGAETLRRRSASSPA
jgi:hypothetical protein